MERPHPGFAAASAVADAVLYEGYLLYPYRRSSGKNQVRWQFGVLAPRSWAEPRDTGPPTVAGSAESWYQQTECLLEARPGARLSVRLRFLHVQARQVEAAQPGGAFEPVDELEVAGQRHVAFEEAVPVAADLAVSFEDLIGAGDGEPKLGKEVLLDWPAWRDVERLGDAADLRGRVVRQRRALSAAVTVSARTVGAPFPLVRLRVRVENRDRTVPPDAARPVALQSALVAAHVLIGVDEGAFVSLLEPPEWAAAAAGGCANVHTFPVLASPTGGRQVILSSPIILYDHPRVAPESPGDLFDAVEIDEILSLRVLTLSDEEKQEARETDARAAAIVDRVEAMRPDVLAGLHGTRRDGAAPGEDPEDGDDVVVAGRRVGRGTTVRLQPRRRGTDAHDMFLAGRTATVEKVLVDMEGARHLAVTIDDDPAAELHQWYGRFHYFSPDEVEPLGTSRPTRSSPSASRRRGHQSSRGRGRRSSRGRGQASRGRRSGRGRQARPDGQSGPSRQGRRARHERRW